MLRVEASHPASAIAISLFMRCGPGFYLPSRHCLMAQTHHRKSALSRIHCHGTSSLIDSGSLKRINRSRLLNAGVISTTSASHSRSSVLLLGGQNEHCILETT